MRISNYWASATVTVMLRKGGGQNEITEGVIAGSSSNVYRQPVSIYLAQEYTYYCLYFMDGEVEAWTTGLLFLLVLHWSSLYVPLFLC